MLDDSRMVLQRDVRVVRKRKRKEKSIVTQQVKCFVPIVREGHFEDGDLMRLEPSVVMTAKG